MDMRLPPLSGFELKGWFADTLLDRPVQVILSSNPVNRVLASGSDIESGVLVYDTGLKAKLVQTSPHWISMLPDGGSWVIEHGL